MKNVLLTLAVLSGLVLLLLAGLALTGIATIRQPEPAVAGAATTALLMLPVLGISTFFKRRSLGLVVGAIVWPLALLSGLPLYFPEERAAAINLGLTLVGLPLGGPLEQEQRANLADRVDALLVTPEASQPRPTARKAADPLPPPVYTDDDDQVSLPYDGTGHSLLVPVTVDGPNGKTTEISLLFDTGATYTTLDAETIGAAGYAIASDAPRITSHTANGAIETPLVLVERMWVGGLEVPGVTVALCNACTDGQSYKGVLGLNVSGRFLVTLDTARREMVLKPRRTPQRLQLDVEPWLDLDGRGLRWADGRTDVQVDVRNRSTRTVRDAQIKVRCPGGEYRVPLPELARDASARETASVPADGACETFSLSLATADW